MNLSPNLRTIQKTKQQCELQAQISITLSGYNFIYVYTVCHLTRVNKLVIFLFLAFLTTRNLSIYIFFQSN